MSKKKAFIILYPITAVKLNEKQKDGLTAFIMNEYKELKVEDLIDIFDERMDLDELKKSSATIKEAEGKRIFKIAATIVESMNMCKETLLSLAELGKVFNVSAKETDIDINIYKLDEVNQFEYLKTVRNFSKVSAAIAFIPFVPIADFIILTPIQIGMVAKISNIYEFDLDPKEFLKMVGGTIGAGILMRTTSKILYSLVPIIGWAINAAIAFAGTYAIGILAKKYIEEKGNLTKESIQKIWERSYKEGKKEFNIFKEYIMNKKEDLIKEFNKYTEEEQKENKGKTQKSQQSPKSKKSNSGQKKTKKQ